MSLARTAAVVLLLSAFARPVPAGEIPVDQLFGLVDTAAKTWATVKDYTCTFFKQERVKGDLLDKETIAVKFRVKPHSVYMKWIKDPHEGRETLFVKGWNDDEIKAHEGGLLGAVNANLDPRGSMAMKDNRHTVLEAGIGTIINLVKADLELAKANGEGKFEDLGMKTLEGANLRCFKAAFPPEKCKTGINPEKGKYYSPDIMICIDGRTGLPVAIEHKNAKGQLEEYYMNKDLRLNVGLTDKDFDPDNDAYRF